MFILLFKKVLLILIAVVIGCCFIGHLLILRYSNVLDVICTLASLVSAGVASGALIFSIITFNKQKKSSELQRFESTFFNMMSLQEQIVTSLTFEESIGAINKKGKQVFEYLWIEINTDIPIKRIADTAVYDDICMGMRDVLHVKGLGEYEEYPYIVSIFDHYFRHMYRIMKFLDEAQGLEDSQKYAYACILRATLSRYELVWLFYNGLSEAGRKFKNYVEKYSILKNLREDLLAYSKDEEIDKEGVVSDYDKYITNEKNCPGKYHLSAFANPRNPAEYNKMCEYYKNAYS